MRSTDAVPSTTPAAMAKRQAWAGQYFASATTLPLLFVFDEKIIAGIPAAWQPGSLRRHLDANRTETVVEGTDPATGLRRDGFTFTLPARTGAIWFYRRSDRYLSPLSIHSVTKRYRLAG